MNPTLLQVMGPQALEKTDEPMGFLSKRSGLRPLRDATSSQQLELRESAARVLSRHCPSDQLVLHWVTCTDKWQVTRGVDAEAAATRVSSHCTPFPRPGVEAFLLWRHPLLRFCHRASDPKTSGCVTSRNCSLLQFHKRERMATQTACPDCSTTSPGPTHRSRCNQKSLPFPARVVQT